MANRKQAWRRILAAVATATVVVILVAGARSSMSAAPVALPSAGGESANGFTTVRVRARPIPLTRAPKAKPAALPKTAEATFPGFNGDAIFVVLEPRTVGALDASRVLVDVIRPIMSAAAFPARGAGSVVPPRKSMGTPLRKANLSTVAALACQEFEREPRDRLKDIQAMCDVMTGRADPSAEVDLAFLNGEGMTFAQFKADLERRQIQYFFSQHVGGVPIEHAGLLATRWEGETVTTVHGTLFTRFVRANLPKLSFSEATARGLALLRKLRGVAGVNRRLETPGVLVLLPWGRARDASGRLAPALRYAYRTLVRGAVVQPEGKPERASWIAYFDAATGAILELIPQDKEVSAAGERWRRDPGTPTVVDFFQVDPASGGTYTLQRAGVWTRVDRLGDGDFDDGEVAISSSSGGSSSTFANFSQSPLNDDANAVCASGGNNSYRQINAFAHLSRMREMVVGAGTIPTFPQAAVTIWTDTSLSGNSANYDYFGSGQSRLNFVAGAGFAHALCPNAPGVFDNSGSNDLPLPGTNDPTSMVHEFGHIITPRLQERRPSNWCGMASCPMPTAAGHDAFHDFADGLGHAYASVNCQGGYSRKNVGGANASFLCVANHNEGGLLPRLSDAAVPFDPAVSVHDHFPEKRAVQTSDYADGQIAGAALWATRRGMRSKCLPSGTPQYFIRLIRALYAFGFLASASGADRERYRFLQDLEKQLVNQWATSGQPGGPPGFAHNGAHTTNKVTSGFARAGMFLVPWQCIDGDNATTEPSSCPGGENGGDAIVDVADNDPADDPTIDGVLHPENDWLERAGPPPTFHIWTGPRFKFTAAGSASGFTPSLATPSPCYVQFQVEVSDTADFSGTVATSTPGAGPWQTVSQTTVPQCYATWTMGVGPWNMLKGSSGDVRLYYRVRTRNVMGDAATERISTSPGAGLYAVPAAYAVVRESGQP